MTLNDLLPLIGGLGIGGILGIVVKHFLDKKSELKIKLKAINEEKYRTVLIYMSIILNPRNKDHFVLNDNILYSLTTENDIREYSTSKLNEYYFQSLLYASDDVMRAFKSFLNDPSRENYIISAQKMRIDLWNSKTQLKISEI
ncbi:hypothetical protein [Fluviicola sp.]|uniref:hypothetical protein n=1 Tax=Fluviicola sp. TaxID=1917219 RepID=UPI0031D92AEA